MTTTRTKLIVSLAVIGTVAAVVGIAALVDINAFHITGSSVGHHRFLAAFSDHSVA